MKNVVVNFVVLLWASVYLLVRILMVAVREVRDDVRQITGEVSLIRSILFLCAGIVATGSVAVFIALFK